MSTTGYWILQVDGWILMFHRIHRNGIYSDFCVGESHLDADGVWEVSVATSYRINLQKVVAKCGSQEEATKVLWDQRQYMNWGYFQ